MALSTFLTVEVLLSAAILCYVALIAHRLWVSPLAKFPGPRLAAATSWYETYYDVVKDGLFFRKIQRLHRQYGPIVRITPREVHIADSSFFDAVYTGRVDKDPAMYDMINAPQSIFGTTEHELHRLRRSALNPYFSRANIDAQVPVVQRKTLALCDLLLVSGSQPVRLDVAFEALTIDVITHCAFGKSHGCIDNPQLAMEMSETLNLAAKCNHINRAFPPVRRFLNSVPSSILVFLVPRLKAVVDLQNMVRDQVTDIMTNKDEWAQYKNERKSKPTVYHQLLTSDLPAHELTARRLMEDGTVVVSAGFSTTARALTVGAFHLISNPSILATLRAEVAPQMARAKPDLPTYSDLEKLPFLTAVVKESIRLSWGTSGRLPRLIKSPLVYKEFVIPAGTSVSMNNNDVLMDPDIFTDPESFIPERWLNRDGTDKALDKYFVAFSKGPRSCIGMWLAYAEMYIAVATLFSKFEFELFETDARNVTTERDFFLPQTKPGFEDFKVVVQPASA